MQKDAKLLFLSLFPSLTLNALTYPLILGKTKIDGLLTLFKYSIKYLEFLFLFQLFLR